MVAFQQPMGTAINNCFERWTKLFLMQQDNTERLVYTNIHSYEMKNSLFD